MSYMVVDKTNDFEPGVGDYTTRKREIILNTICILEGTQNFGAIDKSIVGARRQPFAGKAKVFYGKRTWNGFNFVCDETGATNTRQILVYAPRRNRAFLVTCDMWDTGKPLRKDAKFAEIDQNEMEEWLDRNDQDGHYLK